VTQSGSLLTVDPATTTMTPLAQTTATKVITAATDADHEHVVLAAAEVLTVHDIGLGVSRTVPMDECVPVSISFVPHSTLLMVACRQADLRTVDTATGRTIATTMLPYGGASTVTVAPNGEVYATGMTGLLYRTEPQLKTKHALENFRATPNLWQSIAISGDGNVMVLVGDGTGRISRTTVGRRTADGAWDWYMVDLPTRPGLQSRAATVNKDGSVAAIGLSDGTVHFWLPLASNPGRTYTEVTGAVRGLAFTGTGTNVVAVTRDGVVDALPGCSSCGSGTALAAEAEARVDAAERMGLIAR
jgi:WD40 repeat protein